MNQTLRQYVILIRRPISIGDPTTLKIGPLTRYWSVFPSLAKNMVAIGAKWVNGGGMKE